jgi:CHAT domain-containing protein
LLRGGFAATGEVDSNRGFQADSVSSILTPTFKVDTKALFAHPYYWAPFVLIGNWK